MKSVQRGVFAARLTCLAILFACLAGCGGNAPAAQKPKLLLLTGLPLLFSEGFTLESKPAPLIDRLNEAFDVTAIGATDQESLKQGSLLFMAQPRAQTAENLVELDQWVRAGGKLLLFADPRLEWPSQLPLSDPTRPPLMFADTGLLGHWGLRLDAPDTPGPAEATIQTQKLKTVSPGKLVKIGGNCDVEPGQLVARCVLGAGKAIVVADADLLDLSRHGQSNGDPVIGLIESLAK